MFIAKFQQADINNKSFKADKWGKYPMVGSLIAGTARGTIINGTIFELQSLKTNVAYLCQNVTNEYEGRDVLSTEVVTEVSTLELVALMGQLGPKNLIRKDDKSVGDSFGGDDISEDTEE